MNFLTNSLMGMFKMVHWLVKKGINYGIRMYDFSISIIISIDLDQKSIDSYL